MKRKKRILKKISKYRCPKCGCKSGIIAHFVNGRFHTQLFVYCANCNWEYNTD